MEADLERLVIIAIAGALGTLSRYGVQLGANYFLGPTVLGTLAINLTGSLAIGLLLGWADGREVLTATQRVALAVGFLGAYTTFSTLMIESIDRIESGRLLLATGNLAGSVALGLFAVYFGLVLGRTLS